jgi:hypothetical protein
MELAFRVTSANEESLEGVIWALEEDRVYLEGKLRKHPMELEFHIKPYLRVVLGKVPEVGELISRLKQKLQDYKAGRETSVPRREYHHGKAN